MKVEIRLLDGAWAEEVAGVEAICFPPAEAAGLSDFRERFSSPAYCCYGALDRNGKLVGFVNGALFGEPSLPDELYHNTASLNADGSWQTVFGLDVLPQYRRQGIATQLLETLIEETEKKKKAGIVLTCKDHLRPLYESVGFVWQGVSVSTHGNAVWNDMLLKF